MAAARRCPQVWTTIIPEPYVLLADAGFTSDTGVRIFAPFRNPYTLAHFAFNAAVKAGRDIVERTFALLKGLFPRVSTVRGGTMEAGADVLVAACILYNCKRFKPAAATPPPCAAAVAAATPPAITQRRLVLEMQTTLARLPPRVQQSAQRAAEKSTGKPPKRGRPRGLSNPHAKRPR